MIELFQENSCFEDFKSKGARTAPKMRSFRYYKKSMQGTFLIFCMKLLFFLCYIELFNKITLPILKIDYGSFFRKTSSAIDFLF